MTVHDMQAQHAELLPIREALGGFNFASIAAENTAVALNVDSDGSKAAAAAIQVIEVDQD